MKDLINRISNLKHTIRNDSKVRDKMPRILSLQILVNGGYIYVAIPSRADRGHIEDWSKKSKLRTKA